ncbi:MAG: PD-(D/E)XK nuclease family protein [Candidatus Tectomicrobia bacterium]|uniref:PD-(D/E)XK nuclease family protein n=1 Tax=Tectimicrobiota bacterium TaxID=2528274 RepID=A0A932MLX9_UNCTE|nr:PD-(D/E)XK nuclease family protein [Candidatus Tectomicrobia bacterium]
MTRSSPENVSLDRIARLLEGYVGLAFTARRREVVGFDRLLRGFRPHWEALQADRCRDAFRFNVFDALAVRDKEVLHSRFLAYLLDPGERHDQGERFLRRFLQGVLEEGDPRLGTTQAVVQREVPVGDWGQLDICIWLPGHVIAIENKVHALEGDNQIGRYHGWLASQRGEKTLVFLTPRGDRPVSAPDGIAAECKCLSYGDLADILWASIQDMGENALKYIMGQYVGVCRDLHRSYGGEVNEQRSPSVPDGS